MNFRPYTSAAASLLTLVLTGSAVLGQDAGEACAKAGGDAAGQPAPMAATCDEDQDGRRDPEAAQRKRGPAERPFTVDQLVKQLRGGDLPADQRGPRGTSRDVIDTSAQAAMSLGRRHDDPDIKSALPALRMAEESPDPGLRFHAAVARWRIEPGSPSPIPMLEEALEDDDPDVALWAAHALAEAIGEKAHQAVPIAIAWLARPPGPLSRAYVPGQVEHARRVENRHKLAREIVGRLGRTAEPALWNVVKGQWAAIGSEQITRYQGRPGPDDKQFRAREPAAMVLAERGDSVIPGFVDVLETGDTMARRLAARVLGKFGSKARPAIPALRGLLRYSGWPGADAADALRLIGPHDEATVTALAKACRDPYWVVRVKAAEALGSVKGEHVPLAVAALIRMFDEEPDGPTCARAIRSLGNYIPDNADALATVRRAVHHPKPIVERFATDILRRLQETEPAER